MRKLSAAQTRMQAKMAIFAWTYFAGTYFVWTYIALLCVLCAFQVNAASSAAAISSNALAQLGDAYFETIGDSESIPDNNVTAIAEDASGLIWIGTPSGLIRYDGYRFRRYTRDSNMPNSLGGVFIRALALATDGKLWIGTDADGLSVYDPKTETFTQFRHRDKDAGSLSHDTVRALAATPDGGMWVGTRAGINLQRSGRTDFVQFPMRLGADTIDLDNRILSLLLDKRGELWVGSWNGLSRLPPNALASGNSIGSGAFIRVQQASTSTPKASLIGELIVSLYELRDGRIGIGTNLQGSMIFDLSRNSLVQIPSGSATPTDAMALAMLQPKPDELWLGSFGGIEIVDTAAKLARAKVLRQLRPDPSVQSSLAHSQVRAMMQDRSGHIWIGGYSGGLQRHDPSNDAIRVLHHSPMHPNGLSSPSVGSLMERSNGELWLGTRENGIDIIERSSGRLRSLKPQAGNSDALGNGMVISLAETSDRAVWAGTLAGLYRLDPDTLKFRGYDEQSGVRGSTIRRLLAGKNDELWIGTNTGLFRWTPGMNSGLNSGLDRVSKVSLAAISTIKLADGSDLNADVNALALQPDGRLWVGSTIGLHTLAPGALGLQTVQGVLNGGAQSARPSIVGLLVDRQNRVWVDTSEGLNLLTQLNLDGDGAITAVFDPVSDRLGIAGKSFGANLLEDASGRIWTQQHVLASDAKSVYVLSKSDGIEFGTAWFRSYASTQDGLLLFGGSKGVLIVDPQKFQPRGYQPPLIVTELSVAGQLRPVGELDGGLDLKPGAANFSVEFAALEYSAPQRVRYSHRLDGFDADWIETDANRRVASYTNLAPGTYTLRVRAQTPAGGWTPHELTLSVRALPAYWQTTWFALAMTLLGIAIVYIAVRRHALRVGRHERELEQMVAERTLELSSAKESAEHALGQLRGAQRQLVQAEKMASLGQLVAGVAHELNTPLGIALTASSMLSDESRALKKSVAAQSLSSKQLNAYLDVAEQAGAMVDSNLVRAAQLVRSFKQVSLDRSTDARRRFELSGYLSDLLTGLELSWKRRPIHLELKCASGLILDSYPDALSQIIGTLSQNALQHAFAPDAAGNMQISADAITLENGANAVRLVFSDDGKGISEADLVHVFEPFFTTQRGQGSIGLGLHIVFNLVHTRLGGVIEVASTLGAGTRFTVTFPCVAP